MNRALSMPVVAAAAVLTAAAAAAAPAAPPSDPRALSGVWWTATYAPRLLPDGATALPFTGQGKARYAANMADLKSGKAVDEAVHLCVPEGMPRAMTGAYPFQIIQSKGQVTFVHEANRAYRNVRLAATHADPDVWDPSYMGEGIARWDGDVLVIDSANFKADKIYLDSTGVPVSEGLHLVERIRLLDGGRRLEDVMTISDPAIFIHPWSARRVFERRDDIQVKTDWVCGEPHRDISSVKGTAAR